MPSMLDTRLQESGYDQIWARLASLVTYTPISTGVAISINAIFNDDAAQVNYETAMVGELRVGSLEIRTMGPDAVVGAVRDDTVTVDGEVWTVTRVLGSRPGWMKLELSRVETLVKGNPYKERH